MELLGHDDDDASRVLRHSSAHILGACFENLFGAQLTIGPPTDDGFFYDAYMGSEEQQQESSSDSHGGDTAGGHNSGSGGLTPDDLLAVTKVAQKQFVNRRVPFERVVISKEEALDLFADNPFKLEIIRTKVPDGATTTACVRA